ncbi:hypothetical protein K438DRAFT_857366 [Mycena galopus ATCC 62051]|nr:hypothetical protein K438DRAFT_857366 [Mycena galopus ATCC 62051]
MGVGQYTMDPPPPRSRAASPSALGSHNVVPLSTPPADPTTQTTSQLSSTPPHAQPTGIPWPPLGLGNYAAPPGPPPAGWRAASPPTQAIDDTVPLGTDAPPTTHVTMEFLRTAPPTLPRLPSPPRGLGNYVSPPAGSRAASPSAWDHTDIVPSGTGTPLPTHATLQSGRTASPPTSSCAPPPRPPRPPLGLGNYGPPPAGSRAASPSAWDHTDIAPSGTGTPPMMHVTLQSVRTTPPTSSYAPPPRPPPPPLGLGIYGPPLSPPPAQSRTAFPTPWGGDNAVPLSPPPAYTSKSALPLDNHTSTHVLQRRR